ncbi:MAG: lipopolysaccharide heptosyltransferase II [Candidatus Omnitrophota bacterium]|nr:lipopolysaccharide heptosyltransferase II [Candidatus Omnitrophota bacterium]
MNRILVVRLDRIGDVLLSTPVIKNLRDAYPDSYIAFMVRPYARSIVQGNPYLNDVIVYDKKGEEKSLLGNLKFIYYLKQKRFNAAIILHPTNRTHMITFLAGIPSRVGYDKKWGFLLTKRIPHTKQFGLKHEIDYTLDILRYIAIEPKDRMLYMPLDRASERKVQDIFNENGIRDSDFCIAINPGASCASKRWPVMNFARTADSLAKTYNAKIIIIASVQDKIFADEAASVMSKPCVNLAGKTGIGDVVSVLGRVKLFISNDSGPVHIACAVGTPVISIFGRSDRGLSPERWGPSGACDIALHKYVGCDVCLAHNCRRGFKCLEAITVEDVLAAADKILE